MLRWCYERKAAAEIIRKATLPRGGQYSTRPGMLGGPQDVDSPNICFLITREILVSGRRDHAHAFVSDVDDSGD